jgi:hypothetical protein
LGCSTAINQGEYLGRPEPRVTVVGDGESWHVVACAQAPREPGEVKREVPWRRGINRDHYSGAAS